jgi:hypothetical protein
MSIPSILFLIALVFAVIELVKAKGNSLTLWALVLVCVGLTWGLLR